MASVLLHIVDGRAFRSAETMRLDDATRRVPSQHAHTFAHGKTYARKCMYIPYIPFMCRMTNGSRGTRVPWSLGELLWMTETCVCADTPPPNPATTTGATKRLLANGAGSRRNVNTAVT